MAYIWNYLENEFLCTTTCDGAGENDIVTNPQAGELGAQLNVCCNESPCNYVFDFNTGLQFPVLCS